MIREAASSSLRVCKFLAIELTPSLRKSAGLVWMLLLLSQSLASADNAWQTSTLPEDFEVHNPHVTACGHGAAGQGYGPGDFWNDPVCDARYGCHHSWVPSFGRLRVRGEYLLWWTQGSRVGPLVTTSPTGTPRNQAGVLGQDTSILFGDTGLTDEARSGGRITMTWWLQPDQCSGIEATYLGLGKETTRYRATSDGDPILARPFFSVRNGVQDSRLIAFQDVGNGSISVDATTELQGIEVLMRRALIRQGGMRIDGLLGWRFNRLDDDLLIAESTVSTDPLTSGTIIDLFDRFETRNHFHGAELGVSFEERYCRWSLEMLMKLAFGNTHSQAVIGGSTTTTVPGQEPLTSTGGLLALPTNIGVFQQNHFSMVPELGITLGYDLTRRLRATFGYTLIYWSRVARAGDQIDFDVNDSQFSGGALDGAPRPEFSWKTTDFWAQGMNFGLDYRF